MIKDAIRKIVEHNNLTSDEAEAVMNEVLEGLVTDAQLSAYLTALRMKGETVDEIIGSVRTIRSKVCGINISDPFAVDTCGTGGDGTGTINVSTISAFVAAGAGVTVAKHGNRSVSSKTGSADLLAALGVNINLGPADVASCIEKVGIGFLFAPLFHQAMRHAVKPRKEIGIRTVFNILGPLSNPASVKRQLMGVFSPGLTEPLAQVLKGLQSERVLVVHGLADGVDELSVTGETQISELINGEIKSYVITPEDFGINRCSLKYIVCEDTDVSKDAAIAILTGEKGAMRDVILLNAGAAIAVSTDDMSISEGILRAKDSIDSGEARKKLKELVEFSNALS